MAKFIRPDWDEYFMNIAAVVKTRGNCSRRQVAAVIVKNRRIISTGYNGTPPGIRNCCDGGCARCAAADVASGARLDECICAHAEENAIVQAAYYGVPLRGSVLYCTISPCLTCAKMIITAGIQEVVFAEEYHFNRQAAALLGEAGVKWRHWRPAPT
ncbi:MAG: cytidine/deoxycytidylate deaminase family protein [Kiritimatiellia bacterium]